MTGFPLSVFSRAAPSALALLAAGTAAAILLESGWADLLSDAAAAAAVTLALTGGAVLAGSAAGTLFGLAGAWMPVAGWPGRWLGAAGPALPGFLLAGLAASAGAGAPVWGIAVLAVPAACQAARLGWRGLALAAGSPGVRTAEGLGLGPQAVMRRHVVPLALGPVGAGLGTTVLAAVTSCAAVETLFRIPGAGALLVDSARRGQAGATLLALGILCAVALLLRAIATLLHGWLDPRARTV